MITIFSRYIAQCLKGVGRNSYQGHVNDSGEFWGVPHQASMKTRYSGHLYSSLIAKWTWVDHRDQFSLYKESEKTTLSPVQIHCILPCLQSATLYSLQALLCSTPLTKVGIPACVLCHVLRNRLWALPQGVIVQHHGFRPLGLSMMMMTLGMLATGITCPKGLT
jgi:hypothetical protein